jgi:hypothetical protein
VCIKAGLKTRLYEAWRPALESAQAAAMIIPRSLAMFVRLL